MHKKEWEIEQYGIDIRDFIFMIKFSEKIPEPNPFDNKFTKVEIVK